MTPLAYQSPHGQRMNVTDGLSPLAVSPGEPAEGQQLWLGYIEDLFKQGKFDHFAADHQQRGTEMMSVGKQNDERC